VHIHHLASRVVPVAAALQRSASLQEVCEGIEGAQPLEPIFLAEDALELQAPSLQRPVLLIHGLAQQADTWVNMKNFLCSNADNGYGGVYRSGEDEEFYRQQMGRFNQKVFVLNISDGLASPADTAQEVREALSKIRGATGHQKIDVVTHSMGSLQAREALRQGEDSIANLVMIAPPSQGAYGADLLLKMRKVGYDHYPEGRTGALEALRLEKGPLGGVSNEFLHELNQSWPEDRQRLNSAAIITGAGLPTPDRAWLGASDGDGMVALRRAGLPDTPLYVAGDQGLQASDPNFRDFQMFRYNHLQIVSEAEVYRKVGQILAPPGASQPQASAGVQMHFEEIEPSFRAAPDPAGEQIELF